MILSLTKMILDLPYLAIVRMCTYRCGCFLCNMCFAGYVNIHALYLFLVNVGTESAKVGHSLHLGMKLIM